MQPEFVNHPVSVFITFPELFGPNKQLSVTVWNVSGNLFMKSTSVERSQFVCGMQMRVKEVPSSAHLYLVQLTDECQVQNRMCLLLVASTKVDW